MGTSGKKNRVKRLSERSGKNCRGAGLPVRRAQGPEPVEGLRPIRRARPAFARFRRGRQDRAPASGRPALRRLAAGRKKRTLHGMFLRGIWFGLLLLLAPAWGAEPTLILVSLDAFRWDYLEKYSAETPHLRALAADGVRFPTTTRSPRACGPSTTASLTTTFLTPRSAPRSTTEATSAPSTGAGGVGSRSGSPR